MDTSDYKRANSSVCRVRKVALKEKRLSRGPEAYGKENRKEKTSNIDLITPLHSGRRLLRIGGQQNG